MKINIYTTDHWRWGWAWYSPKALSIVSVGIGRWGVELLSGRTVGQILAAHYAVRCNCGSPLNSETAWELRQCDDCTATEPIADDPLAAARGIMIGVAGGAVMWAVIVGLFLL